MIYSVQSFLGRPLMWKGEQKDVLSAIYFSPETGKLTGGMGKKKDFFPFSELLFSRDGIALHTCTRTAAHGVSLLGYVVRTTHGENIGTVTDIEFDADMGVIKRILVTKSVFGVPFSQRIFPFERILHIREKTILVDDDVTEKETQRELCPA